MTGLQNKKIGESLKDFSIDDFSPLVWRVLKGMPIQVFDEDTDSVWENDLWELVELRSTGEYAGSRAIGSANLVAALNLLHQKIILNYSDDADVDVQMYDASANIFNQILSSLQEQRLIRKKPERLRQTFQVINNG